MKQYDYKVVGVTFTARDGSDRQQTLKKLFSEEVETDSYLRSHDIRFEGYDYKGDDALAVFVDGNEIGNIAADKVQDVAEIAQKAKKCTVTFAVNGHDVDDYEYIVDRHKHKKDWKESDPFFDAEEADEEYSELMEKIKEEAIYSAVLHLFVEGEEDKEEIKTIGTNVRKKDYPIGLFYFLLILSIVLILMCLLLMIVKPVFGMIGVAFGVWVIVYARKNIKEKRKNGKIE